jgi:hypothetical protein
MTTAFAATDDMRPTLLQGSLTGQLGMDTKAFVRSKSQELRTESLEAPNPECTALLGEELRSELSCQTSGNGGTSSPSHDSRGRATGIVPVLASSPSQQLGGNLTPDQEVFWMVVQQTLLERNRREKVSAFLKLHGFKGVNKAKGFSFNYSYPLHVAVEEMNAEMVKLLLQSGADRNLRDCSGRSARVLARNSNIDGSHSAVLEAFSRRPEVNAVNTSSA